MDISVNEQSPIDELFDQATEDTSHFLWAAEAWTDPPEGYEKDYLLILVLANRARSRMALKLIDSDIPPDYKVYKERLENMQRTADKELNTHVLNNTEEIEHIVSTQLIKRLNTLEKQLQKVSKIAQDGDLLADPDWVAEDLRDTSLDFLIQFQQFALMGDEFKTSPFDSAVNSKKYQERLNTIDRHFKQCFGYFNAISDMFPDFQKREYGRKCWWFDRIPDQHDIQGEENIDSLVDSLAYRFRAEKDQAQQECLKIDKTTDYARGEIDFEKGNKIREHIHSCWNCLNVFLDAKIAEENAQQQDGEDTVMDPGVQKAVGDKSPASIIDKLKTKISEFLSPPIMPKPLPALATVCLLVIISVYSFWNEPALPPVTPTSIEMILHGRTSSGFRGGETKYKEFLIGKSESLKSGDFFRVQIKLDQDANVYIVFHDSTDKISGIKQGFIASGEEIFLPDRNNWYQLDNSLGQETIYVVASANEIPDFDNKINELKKDRIAKIDQIFPDAAISSFPFKHQ